MSKTEKLERLRAARSQLQPILDHAREDDSEVNRILTAISKLEAKVQYGRGT